jgi:glycosyltransferase involved in cell wall biosynthesis
VPEQTGYLVPVGDRGGFARWANVLLRDAELAHRLGAAGRARILSEFSVERMVARHAGLYAQLVAGEPTT